MSWPASKQTLANAFKEANDGAIRTKQFVTTIRDISAAGETPRKRVINLYLDLQRSITEWVIAKSLPGIVAYAREEFNDPTLDVATEFNAMQTSAETLRDWIYNNFPKDASSGAWLVTAYDTNGELINLTFTSSQLSVFRTHADTFLATIS